MGYGVEDFLIAFEVLEKWPWYRPFFIEQGLEKICKAYLIGKKSSEYRNVGYKKARKRIHQIAQSLGHQVSRLVTRLASYVPTVSEVIGRNYDGYSGRSVLMVLEKAYTETRYPVDEPISLMFPIPGTRKKMHWDPLGSSSLQKCAFAISKEVIDTSERQFGVQFPSRNPFSHKIDDHTWERFCRLLLGRENLCEKCRSEMEIQ